MIGGIVFGLLFLLAPIALIGGVVAAVMAVRRRDADEDEAEPGIGTVRRLFYYGIAFLALIFVGVGLAMLIGGVLDGAFGDLVIQSSDTQLAISNMMGAPFLWLAALGVGPLSSLGWFDTPVPYISAVAALLAFCGSLVHGWSAMWWQKAVAVTVVGVALLAYPVILLQESRVQAGNAVQPRYILPMMLMLVGLSLLRRRGRVWRLNLFQVVVLAGGLALGPSLALYSNLVRYVKDLRQSRLLRVVSAMFPVWVLCGLLIPTALGDRGQDRTS